MIRAASRSPAIRSTQPGAWGDSLRQRSSGWRSSPAPRAARAEAPANEPVEITVRGSASGGFASQVSTDTAPRTPLDAASMLAELPSVHVRHLGADGAFATLSIRGSASSQVGVVLAGIPLTSAADPSFDVGALPLWPGASFRVYRGFAPASLGTTGYLGGVLAIEAPSPSLGARTEALLAGGSFGSLKLRVGDTRKVGDLELAGGVFASRSDGDFTYDLADPATGKIAPHARQRRARRGGRHRARGAGAAVGQRRRARLRRRARARRPRDLGLHHQSRAPQHLAPRRRRGRLDPHRRRGRDPPARVGSPRGLDAPRSAPESSTRRTPRRRAAPSSPRASRRAGAAGLARRSSSTFASTRAPSASRPRSAIAASSISPALRFAGGGGAELEWRAAERLAITASARLDARRDDASGSFEIDGKTPLGISSELRPSGHLGASYRIADAAVISAHAGALGRPPSFQELYGNGASLVGDAELRPERALSADVGVQGNIGDRRAALAYEAAFFVTSATDLIAFVPLGIATFRAENIDRALLAGAELSASFTARGLRSQVSYTFLFSRNESGDPIYEGRPSSVGRSKISRTTRPYRFGPVGLRYGLDALAGATANVEGTLVLPPRILHGAGVSLDLPWRVPLRLGLDAQNLGDLRTLPVASHQRGSVSLPYSEFPASCSPGAASG